MGRISPLGVTSDSTRRLQKDVAKLDRTRPCITRNVSVSPCYITIFEPFHLYLPTLPLPTLFLPPSRLHCLFVATASMYDAWDHYFTQNRGTNATVGVVGVNEFVNATIGTLLQRQH